MESRSCDEESEMKMSETTEYSAFIKVACSDCGEDYSVKIDAWLVGVRQQIVSNLELSPSTFICASCGQLNQVRATLRFVLDAVQPDQPEYVQPFNIEISRPAHVVDLKKR
jgi:hypothetical protein